MGEENNDAHTMPEKTNEGVKTSRMSLGLTDNYFAKERLRADKGSRLFLCLGTNLLLGCSLTSPFAAT